jgi:type VI secretion system VasD/TssJ family lipoprotein
MRNRNRKRGILCLALATAMLSAVSCVKLTPQEVEERAGQQFFTVGFRATGDLNCFRDEPSSLSLCLYQLTDRKAFDSLRDDPDGFSTLLACEKFDDSVVGRERLFIDPGGSGAVEFERRRDVRYIAIAAGYHDANIADSTLLIEIPAVTVKRGKRPPHIGIILERDRILRDRSTR